MTHFINTFSLRTLIVQTSFAIEKDIFTKDGVTLLLGYAISFSPFRKIQFSNNEKLTSRFGKDYVNQNDQRESAL